MTVLCYGDSNTFGYQAGEYGDLRWPREVRWTGILEAGGWEIRNEGLNGRPIPRRAGEIEDASRIVRHAGADLMTVMLGTNDLVLEQGTDAGTCAVRMERFLSAVLEVWPEPARLLLIAPPPMVRGLWVEEDRIVRESRRLGEVYRPLARRFGTAFADAAGWGVGIDFDGIHITAEGHRAFAKGVEAELRRLTS